jgi:hypothetical protein
VSLFRRTKKQKPVEVDREKDEGIIGLYYSIIDRIDEDFANATAGHLERIHEPGGYLREKQNRDFMELGMDRTYLDALDDLDFTIDGVISVPETALKKRGGAAVVTRWTARGVQSRPLAGVPASGEQVTIEGMTYTAFRNFNIRSEYTYWHMAELTRRMVER